MLHEAIRGHSVLVVEDDYFLAMAIAQELEQHGANVAGPVPCASDALPLLEPSLDAASVDIVLRDDEPCWAIVDKLTRLNVPFLFVTGNPHLIPEPHITRPVCGKPVLEREIVKLVAELIISEAEGD